VPHDPGNAIVTHDFALVLEFGMDARRTINPAKPLPDRLNALA
jgi:hypothetical protein